MHNQPAIVLHFDPEDPEVQEGTVLLQVSTTKSRAFSGLNNPFVSVTVLEKREG